MNTAHQTQVWDLFVRIFHWLFVVLFFLAYVTGDERGTLHKFLGSCILLLVAARIYWGFFGTHHALFSSFVCSPRKAFNYIKELAAGKPTYYLGHNPAAAWMILFLMTSSLVICLSGYLACATKDDHYSFDAGRMLSFPGTAHAGHDEKQSSHGGKHQGQGQKHLQEREKEEDGNDSFWEELHEITANMMVVLVVFHILGAAISSRMHHENLVKSMFTGTKTRT